MRRRKVLALGGAMIGGALGANAQQAPVPIFGVLPVFPPEAGKTFTNFAGVRHVTLILF